MFRVIQFSLFISSQMTGQKFWVQFWVQHAILAFHNFPETHILTQKNGDRLINPHVPPHNISSPVPAHPIVQTRGLMFFPKGRPHFGDAIPHFTSEHIELFAWHSFLAELTAHNLASLCQPAPPHFQDSHSEFLALHFFRGQIHSTY